MSSDSYTGTASRPDISGFSANTLASQNMTEYPHALRVETNFEGTRVAVSDEVVGKISIYDYSEINNTWSLTTELSCDSPNASNNFGISMSMDWDAERIVVGASGISNVYTFDYINGAWNQTPRVIEGTDGSEFGISVCIAANDNDLLCVGAPAENKVYVYQNIQGNWNQVFVNDGSDIISRVPNTPTSNIILKPEYNYYGYHVNMSYNGDYVIAGAPGANMGSNIYTSNIQYIETTTGLSEPAAGLDYPWGFDYYLFPEFHMRHVGNVRVLYINGDTWSQGQGGSIQLGNDIEGTPGKLVLSYDNAVTDYDNGYRNRGTSDLGSTSHGWSMPAFGMCTHVFDDNSVPVITVASPLYSPIGDRAFCTGRIDRFIYSTVTQTWNKYGETLNPKYKQAHFGWSFKYDYSGERIAIGLTTQEIGTNLSGRLHIFETVGNRWVETEDSVLLDDDPRNSTVFGRVQMAMTNGKYVFCTSTETGKMYTKEFYLTQKFIGNNLFSGYVGSNEFRVGDNSGLNSSINRILFGGTSGDQGYTNTSIENRSLSSADSSEIIHFKRSGSSQNTDIIRLRSNEIHIDHFTNGKIIKRVLYDDDNEIISEDDSKEFHNPKLVVNTKGDVCINPHVQQDLSITRLPYGSVSVSAPGDNTSSCDSKATFDVNGDVYIRNRLNVNDFGKNRMKGTFTRAPLIFYDTRDFDILYRDPLDTTQILVKSNVRRGLEELVNLYGHVEDDVSYSEEYRGFEFVGSGKITNVINGTSDQERMCVSFWIQLKNVQSSYPNSNLISIASTDLIISEATSVTVRLTSGGISILYEDLKGINSPFSFNSTVTFHTGKWYHIQVQLPGGLTNTPQVTDEDSTEDYRRSYVGLWINNVAQQLLQYGTSFTNFLGFSNTSFTVGGNTANIVMGLIAYWNLFAFNNETFLEPVPTLRPAEYKLAFLKSNFDYGSPNEMLVVKGDTNMSGKLGVGVTNPTEALEVNGIIRNNNPRFYAYTYDGSSTTSTGVLNVFNSTRVNTGSYYDTSLSRFTAPVDGVYEFKFSALHRYTEGVGASELSFAKNGTNINFRGISFTYVTATIDHDYNTAEVMLELLKGDYIEPFIHGLTSGTDIYYSGGLSHFSGKFLG